MDPQQILEAVVSALQQATASAGPEAQSVRAIGMSGILCGPVFVDAQWRPVRPIIPYLDVRARAEVAWLANELEPIWQQESANAALDTYVMPAVYEWVRRHEPEVSARIAKILSLAPYIGRLLVWSSNDGGRGLQPTRRICRAGSSAGMRQRDSPSERADGSSSAFRWNWSPTVHAPLDDHRASDAGDGQANRFACRHAAVCRARVTSCSRTSVPD